MTPEERYESDLHRTGFQPDEAQRLAVAHTQRLYTELLSYRQENEGVLSRLFHNHDKKLKGIYLWGGTGRGKTYLMDCFYECLSFKEKHRVHYHRFMRDIHNQFEKLKKTAKPLESIASELAGKIQLLCLDEFHVNDIADAMIMKGLLRALIDKGVTLVLTSNSAIDDLYKNGLQRELFLPAIELLKEHTDVVSLGSGIDYRAQMLERCGCYFVEQDGGQTGMEFLEQQLEAICPCRPKRNRQLEVNDRLVDYVALADDVIWFDFDTLCNTPRSSHDYIEIAQLFNTVLLSNVIIMGEGRDAAAKRFVHLIDTLYDFKIKLIISAQTEPNQLYQGRALLSEFKRTISRLIEMDSPGYLRSMPGYRNP